MDDVLILSHAFDARPLPQVEAPDFSGVAAKIGRGRLLIQQKRSWQISFVTFVVILWFKNPLLQYLDVFCFLCLMSCLKPRRRLLQGL